MGQGWWMATDGHATGRNARAEQRLVLGWHSTTTSRLRAAAGGGRKAEGFKQRVAGGWDAAQVWMGGWMARQGRRRVAVEAVETGPHSASRAGTGCKGGQVQALAARLSREEEVGVDPEGGVSQSLLDGAGTDQQEQ